MPFFSDILYGTPQQAGTSSTAVGSFELVPDLGTGALGKFASYVPAFGIVAASPPTQMTTARLDTTVAPYINQHRDGALIKVSDTIFLHVLAEGGDSSVGTKVKVTARRLELQANGSFAVLASVSVITGQVGTNAQAKITNLNASYSASVDTVAVSVGWANTSNSYSFSSVFSFRNAAAGTLTANAEQGLTSEAGNTNAAYAGAALFHPGYPAADPAVLLVTWRRELRTYTVTAAGVFTLVSNTPSGSGFGGQGGALAYYKNDIFVNAQTDALRMFSVDSAGVATAITSSTTGGFPVAQTVHGTMVIIDDHLYLSGGTGRIPLTETTIGTYVTQVISGFPAQGSTPTYSQTRLQIHNGYIVVLSAYTTPTLCFLQLEADNTLSVKHSVALNYKGFYALRSCNSVLIDDTHAYAQLDYGYSGQSYYGPTHLVRVPLYTSGSGFVGRYQNSTTVQGGYFTCDSSAAIGFTYADKVVVAPGKAVFSAASIPLVRTAAYLISGFGASLDLTVGYVSNPDYVVALTGPLIAYGTTTLTSAVLTTASQVVGSYRLTTSSGGASYVFSIEEYKYDI